MKKKRFYHRRLKLIYSEAVKQDKPPLLTFFHVRNALNVLFAPNKFLTNLYRVTSQFRSDSLSRFFILILSLKDVSLIF